MSKLAGMITHDRNTSSLPILKAFVVKFNAAAHELVSSRLSIIVSSDYIGHGFYM